MCVASMHTRGPLQAIRTRIWGTRLMDRVGANTDDLSRQLPLRPDGRPFVFGVHPHPLDSLTKSDRVFQGVLDRGTEPAGFYFGEKHDRYALAERVETWLPGSRGWLLESLAPYLEPGLPCVMHAARTIQRHSARWDLRRINSSTVRYAADRSIGLGSLSTRQLNWLANSDDPAGVQLLVALFHEREWHDPRSKEAKEIQSACHDAFQALADHPSLDRHPSGGQWRKDIVSGWFHIQDFVRWEGPRSSGINYDGFACKRGLPSLLCRDFPGFHDANVHVSARIATPSSLFLEMEHWPEPEFGHLSREECDRLLKRILKHSDPEGWSGSPER